MSASTGPLVRDGRKPNALRAYSTGHELRRSSEHITSRIGGEEDNAAVGGSGTRMMKDIDEGDDEDGDAYRPSSRPYRRPCRQSSDHASVHNESTTREDVEHEMLTEDRSEDGDAYQLSARPHRRPGRQSPDHASMHNDATTREDVEHEMLIEDHASAAQNQTRISPRRLSLASETLVVPHHDRIEEYADLYGASKSDGERLQCFFQEATDYANKNDNGANNDGDEDEIEDDRHQEGPEQNAILNECRVDAYDLLASQVDEAIAPIPRGDDNNDSGGDEEETVAVDHDGFLKTPGPQRFAEDVGDIAKARAASERLLRDEGMLRLVTETLLIAKDDKKTLSGPRADEIRTDGYQVTVTTHPEVLAAICSGDLVERCRTSPELKDILSRMRQQASNDNFPQPAIYANILTDHLGKSPTPNQLLGACEAVERYCNADGASVGDAAEALRIDRHRKPHGKKPPNGRYRKRKYLMSGDKISTTRLENVSAFIQALRLRLEQIPIDQRDLPLRCPLIEIGYTHKSARRLKDHKAHRSSNYIMNLFEAVMNVLTNDGFHIKQFVIFLCTAASQASIAEVLFTRLAQGYTMNGGGFSHYAAGRSNSSASQYRSVDWERFYEWTHRNINPTKNHEAEKVKWERTPLTQLATDLNTISSVAILGSLEEDHLKTVAARLHETLVEESKDLGESYQEVLDLAKSMSDLSAVQQLIKDKAKAAKAAKDKAAEEVAAKATAAKGIVAKKANAKEANTKETVAKEKAANGAAAKEPGAKKAAAKEVGMKG